MVKSMTGYGSDTFHFEGTVMTIEIKSINSRYLDFIPKIPRSLQETEFEIKKCIQTYFHRGRIEVFVSITGEPLPNKQIQVNWDLVDQYIAGLMKVKERYGLQGDIPLSVIAGEEALFSIQETNRSPASLPTLLLQSVERVCTLVLKNRKREGIFLMDDILQLLENVEKTLIDIEQRQGISVTSYRERIKDRIERQLERMDIDEAQLLQEIALLAERGDIQEELTRLFSHINHFKSVVEQTTPIGRKLDFITQEMHREVNTIGAKSIDTKVSEAIVTLKSDIEKVKEQVQNIE